MRLHSTLLAIGVALGATAVEAAPVPKEIKRNNDKIRILGNWKQEFMSLRGAEKQPETISTFQFDADGKCGISYDNSPRQNDSEYSLDPTSSPGKMKWLNGTEKTEWRCLYEIENDTLKVCFIEHNAEVPSVLATGKNATIYYLKRVKE